MHAFTKWATLGMAFLFLTPAVAHGQGTCTNVHTCSANGDLARLRTLADRGHDLSAPDGRGRTPLALAVWANHITVIEFLVERGAAYEGRHNTPEMRRLARYILHAGVNIVAIASRQCPSLLQALPENAKRDLDNFYQMARTESGRWMMANIASRAQLGTYAHRALEALGEIHRIGGICSMQSSPELLRKLGIS